MSRVSASDLSLRRVVLVAVALGAWLMAGPAGAAIYNFTGGGADDWWVLTANWNPVAEPGVVAANGDVVIFDNSLSTRFTTNLHDKQRFVKELRFNSTVPWRLHQNAYDAHLMDPDPGAGGLVTQNSSGAVTMDIDLRLDEQTTFGGTGTGSVTVNGSVLDYYAPFGGARHGVYGVGGLTKTGAYALVLNRVAGYQGPTNINAGTLLFNAESMVQNPAWVAGSPATYYLPVAMAPVTVNTGGTLGGTGILRADVTVNSGGTFAPGVSPGVFRVGSLALASGAITAMELGGTTPGNGAGFHDQAITDPLGVGLSGNLSLGGTLNVALSGGFVPNKGNYFTLFQYSGTQTGAFDTVNYPALLGRPSNYGFLLDYGTGANSSVTLSVAAEYRFTGASPANDWWETAANWDPRDPGVVPGGSAAAGDIVVFDSAYSSRNTVNVHQPHHYVREIRFNSAGSWYLYNNGWDVYLENPTPGLPALFTQNGSGPVTLDCDVKLNDNAVFGGTGTGTVTIRGSFNAFEPAVPEGGPRNGTYGVGGLTKNGAYTLVLDRVAGYQGPTFINAGTLLFNADSVVRNPAAVQGDPSTWYLPATLGPVTVNAGGTLGGTGNLRAPVTVRSGGTFAPGASAGIFTVDSLTVEAGGIALFELGGRTPGNGTGFHDQAIVNGALSLDGILQVALIDGFTPVLGDRFVLFQYGSLDSLHDRFTELRLPGTNGWSVDYGTGLNSQVVLTAVPEPGAMALLALGGLGLGAVCRRGRRRCS